MLLKWKKTKNINTKKANYTEQLLIIQILAHFSVRILSKLLQHRRTKVVVWATNIKRVQLLQLSSITESEGLPKKTTPLTKLIQTYSQTYMFIFKKYYFRLEGLITLSHTSTLQCSVLSTIQMCTGRPGPHTKGDGKQMGRLEDKEV